MKTLIAIIAACVVTVSPARAQESKPEAAQSSLPKRISAAEAEKHYQETVIVTGKVAQVSMRPKLVYINLDKKFPESPMTAVIFARATNDFGDLKRLEGKHVEVKGRIEEYKDKPQIILNSTNQLKVIEKAADAGGSKKD